MALTAFLPHVADIKKNFYKALFREHIKLIDRDVSLDLAYVMYKFILYAALVVLFTKSAVALEMTKTVYVDASPATVWSLVSPPCGMTDWYPGIEKCEVLQADGSYIRKYKRNNGDEFTDKLEEIDNELMSWTYLILESSLPVKNFKSSLKIVPEGSGTRLNWVGKFESKNDNVVEAKLAVGGRFDVGLFAIARKFR